MKDAIKKKICNKAYMDEKGNSVIALKDLWGILDTFETEISRSDAEQIKQAIQKYYENREK